MTTKRNKTTSLEELLDFYNNIKNNTWSEYLYTHYYDVLDPEAVIKLYDIMNKFKDTFSKAYIHGTFQPAELEYELAYLSSLYAIFSDQVAEMRNRRIDTYGKSGGK